MSLSDGSAAFGSGARILTRDGDTTDLPSAQTVVLVGENPDALDAWSDLMEDLPADLRVVAATADGSLADVLAALGAAGAHLVVRAEGLPLVPPDVPALSVSVYGPIADGIAPDAEGDVPLTILRNVAGSDRPADLRRALLGVIGYIGTPASPAPPTEAIILSSSD